MSYPHSGRLPLFWLVIISFDDPVSAPYHFSHFCHHSPVMPPRSCGLWLLTSPVMCQSPRLLYLEQLTNVILKASASWLLFCVVHVGGSIDASIWWSSGSMSLNLGSIYYRFDQIWSKECVEGTQLAIPLRITIAVNLGLMTTPYWQPPGWCLDQSGGVGRSSHIGTGERNHGDGSHHFYGSLYHSYPVIKGKTNHEYWD